MNNTQLLPRLRELNAKLHTTDFAGRYDDEPSTLSKLGKAGLALGGAAALGLGASYLRGRFGTMGKAVAGRGFWPTARYGARKLGRDASAGMGFVKDRFAAFRRPNLPA